MPTPNYTKMTIQPAQYTRLTTRPLRSILLSSILTLAMVSLIVSCTASPQKKKPIKQKEYTHVFSPSPQKKPRPSQQQKKDDETIEYISNIQLAKISFDEGNVNEAANLIDINESELSLLPVSKQIEWWQLRSSIAYRQDDIQGVLEAERQLHPLLTVDTRRGRFEIIFERLLQVDRFSLQRLYQTMADNAYARNWLSLALSTTSLPATLPQQKTKLARWKKNNSQSSFANNVPRRIEDFLSVSTSPRNVALLLPQTGPLATFGTAIQEGFLAVEKRLGITTTVYDVHDMDSLHQAMNDMETRDIDAVVGPVDRQLIQEIWTSNRFPLLLALNYLPSITPRHGYVQFGLGIEDEAQLLASISRYNNKHNVLVITEESTKGKRAFTAFSHNIPAARYTRLVFGSTQALAQGISNAVSVSSVDIKKHRHDLKEYEKDPEAFKVSPTEEILKKNTVDTVVVFANQVNSTQVKSLLDFYYAFDTPVLATSYSYHLDQANNLSNEYEGIFIADIPTLGAEFSKWHPMISSAPEEWNAGLTRFYALGIDAAIATLNLQRLIRAPGIQVRGTTGTLGFNPHSQTISRSPILYFVQGGKLVNAQNLSAECSEEQRLCL